MDLKRVKKDCHLHWPTTIADGEKRYRGGEGYVVDLDAPLEAEWCKGQEYKLEHAPEGATPNDLELPHAIGARRKAEQAKTNPGPTVADKAKAAGIMEPEIPGKKATAKV